MKLAADFADKRGSKNKIRTHPRNPREKTCKENKNQTDISRKDELYLFRVFGVFRGSINWEQCDDRKEKSGGAA